ncbi:hypothetical protein GOV04_00370 [Candidatus Woesearchaeota archaeon]|nr:hypothetical protein [Candidatus Woesearchaeota archaeon]
MLTVVKDLQTVRKTEHTLDKIVTDPKITVKELISELEPLVGTVSDTYAYWILEKTSQKYASLKQNSFVLAADKCLEVMLYIANCLTKKGYVLPKETEEEKALHQVLVQASTKHF